MELYPAKLAAIASLLREISIQSDREHRKPTQMERDCWCFKVIKDCMGKSKRSYKHELLRVIFTFYVQNKPKFTSIVVPCRPCCSKRRILVIYWVFAMLSTVHNKRRTRKETGFQTGPALSRFSPRNFHRPTSKS